MQKRSLESHTACVEQLQIGAAENQEKLILGPFGLNDFKLPTLTGRGLQIQGHRGGYQPENTMKAFQLALDNRIEGIELDVNKYELKSNPFRSG